MQQIARRNDAFSLIRDNYQSNTVTLDKTKTTDSFERHQNDVLNYHIWKLKNKRKKIQALDNFEMRLEMTLQRKKMKQKQLEKKFYNHKFSTRSE